MSVTGLTASPSAVSQTCIFVCVSVYAGVLLVHHAACFEHSNLVSCWVRDA